MSAAALSRTLSHIMGTSTTPSSKLQQLHRLLRQRRPVVDRISVALYDSDTDQVKTFIHSPADEEALPYHQAPLASSPSLSRIASDRHPRVINTLSESGGASPLYAMALVKKGYRSSYTLPIFRDDRLLGFIFFNSCQAEVMHGDTLGDLDMLGHLIGMMIAHELHTTNTLKGVVRAMGSITQFRDVETASHLQRMSRLSRLIALQLALQAELNDEFVEYVFLFAPLHDIGKIAIPDDVLLKPGILTEDEFDIMRDHPSRGREMIDQVLSNMELHALPHVGLLRNIIEYHHERWDGSGYPKGLAGENIPLEARIVTVADVFDALVSNRPYKAAWSNEAALAHLQQHAGTAFDPACVRALSENMHEVTRLQRQFSADLRS
jgi:HD-GYP domain-containing protein (c-di-GMP phosphodiesterase class II)